MRWSGIRQLADARSRASDLELRGALYAEIISLARPTQSYTQTARSPTEHPATTAQN